jgi:hypothetical protein
MKELRQYDNPVLETTKSPYQGLRIWIPRVHKRVHILESKFEVRVDGGSAASPPCQNAQLSLSFFLSSLCVAGSGLPMSADWRVGQNPTKGTIAWFLSVLL